MGRALLQVDGISAETKKALQEVARKKYGKANASLLVRALIADHLTRNSTAARPITEDEAADTVRVELRLPRVISDQITALADARLSPRNHYLVSLIMAHVEQPQLQGDEIETLRQSNYELSKIGTNLNQIAKAFNILVNEGSGKLPEIGKKLASLRREITTHIGKVLRVLNSGTTIWEVRQGRSKTQARKGRETHGKHI
ncbi:MAG: MobC family plasmid mobilization relaxosome protein [Candidatus Accumulibacter sp.]|jgi:hypothetical protein|nr:MobC family plasmid mobilization relaxosome protein [Accumulibacter sp.]